MTVDEIFKVLYNIKSIIYETNLDLAMSRARSAFLGANASWYITNKATGHWMNSKTATRSSWHVEPRLSRLKIDDSLAYKII